MLAYEEYFNTVQIAHACFRRIFQCGRVYLHFAYNDIYICYIIFLYKFIVTQRFGETMLLYSLKQVFWKKSEFYIR